MMDSEDLAKAEKEQLLTLLLAEEGLSSLQEQAIPRREKTGDVPLSFAQQRLWVLNQLNPGSASYTIPLAARLRGPLRIAALEHSLNQIIRRHEALRTIFDIKEGQPVQIVVSPWLITLPTVDLSGLQASEREREAQYLVTSKAQQPFDLTRGPLLRACVLRFSTEEHLLLLTVHHVIADGWSIGVLLRELGILYASFMASTRPQLPELLIQYTDYALWQREQLKQQAFEEQLAYWRQQLRDSPPILDVRTDQPRPAVQTFRGAYIPLLLPGKLSEQLSTLSLQQGATLFMTLLSAFKILLARYSGQDDIVVGVPVAGRTRSELSRLLGSFSILSCCVPISPALSVSWMCCNVSARSP